MAGGGAAAQPPAPGGSGGASAAGTPPASAGSQALGGGGAASGAGGAAPTTSCSYATLEPLASTPLPALTGPQSVAVAGLVDGVTSWAPPATPAGLTPQQSWYSVGTTPSGDTYFSSADHVTNSTLYRIDIASDSCAYAGDAKAASQAANNWNSDESAQKFHIRPTYYQGRMYVATTDFSDPNAGYLNHRGFHWYAFDEAQAKFLDLSATEPNGVAVKNFQCMAMTLDEPRGTLYCLGTPNGNLYEYKIATGTTRDLGRPAEVTGQYVTVGRFMWVDEAGTVYFTYSGYDSVFAFELGGAFSAKPDWDLGGLELKFGQWSRDRKRCYLGDYEGRLYVFDDAANTFSLLGQASVPEAYNSTEPLYVWQTRLFQISADEQKYYFMNDSSTGAYALFEFDLSSKMTTKIAELSQLDSGLPGPYLFHSAYDSWDTRGRFSYVNFNMKPENPMRVTRIDPVRVKVASGLLPELVTVELVSSAAGISVTRSGATDAALPVILARRLDDAAHSMAYVNATIPVGAASLDVTPLIAAASPLPSGSSFELSVLPNGNSYVAGTAPALHLSAQCP